MGCIWQALSSTFSIEKNGVVQPLRAAKSDNYKVETSHTTEHLETELGSVQQVARRRMIGIAVRDRMRASWATGQQEKGKVGW